MVTSTPVCLEASPDWPLNDALCSEHDGGGCMRGLRMFPILQDLQTKRWSVDICVSWLVGSSVLFKLSQASFVC